MNIYELSTEFEAIKQQLEENGGELTPELEQAFTMTSEQLHAKMDSVCKLIANLKGDEDAIAGEIDRLTQRKRTAHNSIERLRGLLLMAMDAVGESKIKGEIFACRVNESKKLEVDTLTALQPYREQLDDLQHSLPDWVTIKVDVSKTALKDCEELPDGVTRAIGRSVVIR